MSRPRRGRARITATEAAKNFGRLVDRVREERATYVVERGGVAVARISPADAPPCTLGDLRALVRDRHADEEYLRTVDAAVSRHNRPRIRRNPWAR